MNADTAMTQHIARLTPLADMLAMVRQTGPVPARPMATAESGGLVLASEVVALADQPAHPAALRDGWAVSAEATRDAGPYSPMPLDPPPQRIDAFAPMPSGTDAIAPPDAVTLSGGFLQIASPVAPGDDVLPAGGDVAAGTRLLASGARLRLADVAMLLAAGVTEIRVRVPRLRIVNTKPGLLEPAVQFVAKAAQAQGATVTIEADGNLEGALRAGAVDAVIGISGTGSGRKDRSVIALSRAGTLLCHGVGLSPGDTSAFGAVGGCPVLLVPGRLDAAMASWLLLGRALTDCLAGAASPCRTRPVKLARKVTSTIGISDFVPLTISEDGAHPLATNFISLQHLAQADGWTLVPAESEGYPAGTIVPMEPLP